MWLKNLGLRNYRNYETLSVALSQRLNIYFGNNAQGKTNLLESIYLLALGKSYRAINERELIKEGKDRAQISGQIIRDATMSLEIVFTPGIKTLKVNAKKTTPSRFIGHFNVVLFTPDDLQLIKGPPTERRRFVDREIAQVSNVYRDLLIKYNKILQHRNQLLKEWGRGRCNKEVLGVWDDQMVDVGTRIVLKRSQALQKLAGFSKEMYRNIVNGRESLELRYVPFFCGAADAIGRSEIGCDYESIRHQFLRALDSQRNNEFRRGYSLVGPQRDDLLFEIDGLNARCFASQGQQRSAILACRLAEMEFMRDEAGTYPVVLLDDVMSELDYHRRQFLLQILNKDVQTIITTTHLGSFPKDILGNANVCQIKDAIIEEKV